MRVPLGNCLNCSKPLDAAASLESDDPPRPDDITVCFYCGYIMAFTEDFKLRKLTQEEMEEFSDSDMIRAIQVARQRAGLPQ